MADERTFPPAGVQVAINRKTGQVRLTVREEAVDMTPYEASALASALRRAAETALIGGGQP